jgi:hypothetical protein
MCTLMSTRVPGSTSWVGPTELVWTHDPLSHERKSKVQGARIDLGLNVETVPCVNKRSSSIVESGRLGEKHNGAAAASHKHG